MGIRGGEADAKKKRMRGSRAGSAFFLARAAPAGRAKWQARRRARVRKRVCGRLGARGDTPSSPRHFLLSLDLLPVFPDALAHAPPPPSPFSFFTMTGLRPAPQHDSGRRGGDGDDGGDRRGDVRGDHECENEDDAFSICARGWRHPGQPAPADVIRKRRWGGERGRLLGRACGGAGWAEIGARAR